MLQRLRNHASFEDGGTPHSRMGSINRNWQVCLVPDRA